MLPEIFDPAIVEVPTALAWAVVRVFADPRQTRTRPRWMLGRPSPSLARGTIGSETWDASMITTNDARADSEARQCQ
eukprot:453345-Rhodomonas_salina.1